MPPPPHVRSPCTLRKGYARVQPVDANTGTGSHTARANTIRTERLCTAFRERQSERAERGRLLSAAAMIALTTGKVRLT